MRCIVVDIDQTVADCSHREHYLAGENKNWIQFYAECVFDKPIKKHIQLVHSLFYSYNLVEQTQLIFLTGRPESVESETQAWLCNHFKMKHYLLMRETNKWVPNFIHKRESMEGLIAKGYKPLIFLDDNVQSCKAVREASPTTIVLQVV